MNCKKCQDQLAFFLSGSAHDYYGLLGIMVLGLVGMILFLSLAFLASNDVICGRGLCRTFGSRPPALILGGPPFLQILSETLRNTLSDNRSGRWVPNPNSVFI